MIHLLSDLEQHCMQEPWNARMIEGQLQRAGQLILALDTEGRVECLYSSLAGRPDPSGHPDATDFGQTASQAGSLLSGDSSFDPSPPGSVRGSESASFCGYIWFEDRSVVDESGTKASWELLRIGVLPDYRGQSLGSVLMQKGLQFLAQCSHYLPRSGPVRKEGCTGSGSEDLESNSSPRPDQDSEGPGPGSGGQRIVLEVAENNHPARALYERFGFIVINRRKNYYADSDALIMERPDKERSVEEYHRPL